MTNHPEEPTHDATPKVDVESEAPPDDVLEQHRTDVDRDEREEGSATGVPLEANAADVDEQRRSVPQEEEEWREE